MLETILRNYKLFGNEEYSFDCHEAFEAIVENIEDDEMDIQIIMRYLIENTDFVKWIDKTYHSDSSCDEDCALCQEDIEQADIFNAQSEILKNTQEELRALKKKYNKLLRKYKGLSN